MTYAHRFISAERHSTRRENGTFLGGADAIRAEDEFCGAPNLLAPAALRNPPRFLATHE